MQHFRTIGEWLDFLPPSLKEKAVNYILDQHPDNGAAILHTQTSSFYKAIQGALLWDKTTEGAAYWQRVAAIDFFETSAQGDFAMLERLKNGELEEYLNQPENDD
jgi:hypothetical protein